jgi:hypothetical protein
MLPSRDTDVIPDRPSRVLSLVCTLTTPEVGFTFKTDSDPPSLTNKEPSLLKAIPSGSPDPPAAAMIAAFVVRTETVPPDNLRMALEYSSVKYIAPPTTPSDAIPLSLKDTCDSPVAARISAFVTATDTAPPWVMRRILSLPLSRTKRSPVSLKGNREVAIAWLVKNEKHKPMTVRVVKTMLVLYRFNIFSPPFVERVFSESLRAYYH